MKEHFNPNGTGNKDWGENELLEAETKQVVDEAKKSSDSWGSISGSWLENIVAANTPKISVKEVVRRFAQSVASRATESSRMRRNRRYGLRYPGALRKYTTKILIAVDSSGSMGSDQLADGFAIINATCKQAHVSFMIFDTAILSVENDMKRAKQNFEVKGRGGTDFQCVTDYVNEHKFDGVVIFTDGIAPAPTRPNKTKVLWLLSEEHYKPPCEWGFKAHLKNS